MTRAEELASVTEYPIGFCVRFLEGVAEGQTTVQIIEDLSRRMVKLYNYLTVKRMVMRLKGENRALSEADARAVGKFWTLVCTLTPTKVFVTIYNGDAAANANGDAMAMSPEAVGTMTTTAMGERSDALITAVTCIASESYEVRFH
jgi:hypothetical protein